MNSTKIQVNRTNDDTGISLHAYDLYYDGDLLVNVSLEEGRKMTKEIAFAIINDMCQQHHLKPRKHIEKVTYRRTI